MVSIQNSLKTVICVYKLNIAMYPGETISGYINIERKKGVSMTINVAINGAIYTFPWDINH